MKKKRGRPTVLTEKLVRQICQLLSEGISITSTCDALKVTESRYFDWIKNDEEFREQATRARANGKIALVRKILADKDWRAKAWYLERCWPNEFGRTVDRPLPEAEKPRQISVGFFLNMPDGSQRETSFEEAQRMFGNFPIKDTCEPPAEEGKSSPGSGSDGDASWEAMGN